MAVSISLSLMRLFDNSREGGRHDKSGHLGDKITTIMIYLFVIFVYNSYIKHLSMLHFVK